MKIHTIDTLSQSRIVRCRPPASREEIREAEGVLGVTFPKVYVEFLLRCGVMAIYNRSVFGLGPYTRSARREVLSVVFQTQYARNTPLLSLPNHLVVVWDESHDDPDCLDTSRITKDGDCPVVSYYAPGTARALPKPRQVASGFEQWLSQILERQAKRKISNDSDSYLRDRITFMGAVRTRKRSKKETAKKALRPTKKRKTQP
jgi:SMI1-KNR4 cell-wall